MADDSNYDPLVRVRFNLDSDREDIRPLIEQLNPILRKIVRLVRANPDPSAELDATMLPPGFHKISYCEKCEDEDAAD
jgi:hypothetical protein